MTIVKNESVEMEKYTLTLHAVCRQEILEVLANKARGDTGVKNNPNSSRSAILITMTKSEVWIIDLPGFEGDVTLDGKYGSEAHKKALRETQDPLSDRTKILDAREEQLDEREQFLNDWEARLIRREEAVAENEARLEAPWLELNSGGPKIIINSSTDDRRDVDDDDEIPAPRSRGSVNPHNRDRGSDSDRSTSSVPGDNHALVKIKYPLDETEFDRQKRVEQLAVTGDLLKIDLLSMTMYDSSGVRSYEFITLDGSDPMELHLKTPWEKMLLPDKNNTGKFCCAYCTEAHQYNSQTKMNMRVHVWRHYHGAIKCCCSNKNGTCSKICQSYGNMSNHFTKYHPLR